MTTQNALLAGRWKPSSLMVRILSAFVILAVVIGLALLGTYGAYTLVLILAGLALWEFMGLSEGMGSDRLGAIIEDALTICQHLDRIIQRE